MLTNCPSQVVAMALPSYKDTSPALWFIAVQGWGLREGGGRAYIESDISSNYLYEDGRPLN